LQVYAERTLHRTQVFTWIMQFQGGRENIIRW